MWWGHGFDWGWMLFGGLMMLLFWGGLIALIFVAVRAIAGPRRDDATQKPGPAHPAIEIAKARYARGEISKAEYEEIRQTLES